MDSFESARNGRKIRFVVAYDHTSTFWHKRRYVKVVRSKAEGSIYHTTRTLNLR